MTQNYWRQIIMHNIHVHIHCSRAIHSKLGFIAYNVKYMFSHSSNQQEKKYQEWRRRRWWRRWWWRRRRRRWRRWRRWRCTWRRQCPSNSEHLIVTTRAWRHVSLASSADDDDDDVSLRSDDSSLQIGVVSYMYIHVHVHAWRFVQCICATSKFMQIFLLKFCLTYTRVFPYLLQYSY